MSKIIRIKVDKAHKWVTVYRADGSVQTFPSNDVVGEEHLKFMIESVKHNAVKTIHGETMFFQAMINRKHHKKDEKPSGDGSENER